MKLDDKEAFYDMMSNPNVMNPIPRDTMDRKTCNAHFQKYLKSEGNSETKVWAVDSKDGIPFLGIAAYLKNDKNEDEIGYRLREQFWGNGFGTEIAKGLIDYGFGTLNLEIITANVNTNNGKSVKILDKFFNRDIEFFNVNDNCIDRRYKISRIEWL
ncbi:GNAT family N-acetyltransferase [Snuella sp. CAU 1569]|uniref:GNAT family N-acetyltransferase n=1 Tax=Snuella sedimenti TaxID=2798802 RepID=A0A8J7J9V0_9FLAO|nr:GNAT family N-acetyltransferase [Snuella sedimenti]